MKLPQDPAILLSFLNMKLRDSYASLRALCADMQTDEGALCDTMKRYGYVYSVEDNQFKAL